MIDITCTYNIDIVWICSWLLPDITGRTALALALTDVFAIECLDQAGCRSIQKMCALWKHGLASKNTQSHLTCFCKLNINQIFTNGGGMIWGVRIAIFTEIRHLVEELITFLSIFGPQKLGILTARLNKSL